MLGTSESRGASPVEVRAGDKILVSSGDSPVGFSFRVNKCSGYRSQFKRFQPTVKTSCPDPFDEFIADGSIPFTDNECYDIARRLSSCTTLTRIPGTVSRECRTFFQDVISERGCVDLHRNDSDFFLPEWRLFLGSDKSLWKASDNTLYLVDEDGHLVATLVYR